MPQGEAGGALDGGAYIGGVYGFSVAKGVLDQSLGTAEEAVAKYFGGGN